MSQQIFWNKDRTREYRGRIFVSCTAETHCSSCDGGKRPLARGIAVHFTDENNQTIFTAGPDCFRKHTDLSLSQIPTIGYGFADIKTGRDRTSPALRLGGMFDAAVKGLSSRQDIAYSNVMLRARILPSMGFRINQPGLGRFLDDPFPYAEQTVVEIEKYVAYGEKEKGRPSLGQLSRAFYVANQIKALLEKPIGAGERAFVQSLDGALKRYVGLTDRQMESLEEKSSRYGLLLQQTGIRFPESQDKFSRSPRLDT